MRIVVDATPLLLTSAGVKNYLYYWLRSLQERCGPDSIRLYPFLESIRGGLDHRSAPLSAANALRMAWVHFCNIRHNPVLGLWPWKADVFHASQHMLNPPAGRIPLTATIYDTTCWIVPHTHLASNVIATKRYAERVLKRADACIAISESARQDAVRILRIPQERIATIYPGVSDAFYSAAERDDVRQAYGLGRPYILHVGTIEPRKNVDRLLDAYEALPSHIRANHDLVLAGLYGWASDATRRRLDDSRPRGVRYLGYVPEEHMPALTRSATALVFPSLYEGFGLPVAQAMAVGVPVITSTGSSLEEIAGGVSLLVDPTSVDQLCEAMKMLLESPSLQDRLSLQGRQRAELFRWDALAAKAEEFFRAVAKR
jgi:alpha-1,3-rhamnosyl/mannosyltransferase